MSVQDPLANAVWQALTTAQADVAERAGSAARFPADLSPFAAIDDADDPDAWTDLAALIGDGDAAIFREAFTLPADWELLFGGPGVQLVAPGRVAPTRSGSPPPIEELGPEDAEAMADLVGATRPGPWAARTHTLGPYVGVRDESRLVAMAGTRLHLPPYREISAVCTAPDHQGRGLAGALVAEVAERIRPMGSSRSSTLRPTTTAPSACTGPWGSSAPETWPSPPAGRPASC